MSIINFNNAGASLLDLSAFNAITEYNKLERKISGYFNEVTKKKELQSFYKNAAKLINCSAEEISFTQNSTYGWNLFVNSIKFKKNSNVVIFDNEYGSNYISLLNKKSSVRVSKINKSGTICFENLRNKIDKNTSLVSVCHIASQCGNILDINKLGKFLKKINPKILFIVDACQSAGQVQINVKKNLCDALVCSGRKYLCGPRGTGFIYLRNPIQKKIVPNILDLNKSKVIKNKLSIYEKKNLFELFEHSPALKIGLSKSIEKINKIGVEKIEKKIKNLSRYLREKLSSNSQITFYEKENLMSGINTISMKGINSEKIYSYLIKKKIITSVSNFQTSTQYFKTQKIKNLCRISFHYYNSKSEIDYLVKCLKSLTKKIKN